MKTMRSVGACAFLAFGIMTGCIGSPEGADESSSVATTAEALSSTSYSGRASVLRAQLLKITTNVVDTGPLPSTGGSNDVTLLTANVAGLLNADVLDSYVSGGNEHTVAQSTTADVSLGLSLVNVAVVATAVASHAQASCKVNTPSVSGGSVLTGLRINGTAIVVTGAPNQTINLLLAKVVINERTTKVSGNSASIHTAALHITAAGLVDVSLGVADAGITCGAPPTEPPPPLPVCTDDACGGFLCPPCSDGHGCKTNSDCQSGVCQNNTCVTPPATPTCTDHLKNGAETDVDCGGPACSPCDDGQTCVDQSDCKSESCDGGTCTTVPACTPQDYVTGQGYITSTPAPSTKYGYYSFFAQAPNGMPAGNATYDDDGSSEHVKSISVTSYTPTGPKSRQFQGLATIRNKPGTFNYTIDVQDNGASGDLFEITVSDGYHAKGVAASGTIELFVDVCR
jgi:hypothetical protein